MTAGQSTREPEGPRTRPRDAVLAFAIGLLLGILAGVPAVVAGLELLVEQVELVTTVLLGVLLALGLVAAVLHAQRHRIFRALGLGAAWGLSDALEPAQRLADALVARDRDLALTNSREVARRLAAWFGWVHLSRWLFGALIAVVGALAAFLGSALLYRQNQLMAAQNQYFRTQIAVMEQQNDQDRRFEDWQRATELALRVRSCADERKELCPDTGLLQSMVGELAERNRRLGLRTDLSDISLRDANLEGLNLSGANLQGADLSFASLRGTTLAEADLRGAAVFLADLSGADLRGAQWNADWGLYGRLLARWDKATLWGERGEPDYAPLNLGPIGCTKCGLAFYSEYFDSLAARSGRSCLYGVRWLLANAEHHWSMLSVNDIGSLPSILVDGEVGRADVSDKCEPEKEIADASAVAGGRVNYNVYAARLSGSIAGRIAGNVDLCEVSADGKYDPVGGPSEWRDDAQLVEVVPTLRHELEEALEQFPPKTGCGRAELDRVCAVLNRIWALGPSGLCARTWPVAPRAL